MSEQSEDEVIKRDKEEYPHCHHSTSIRKFYSFSNESGQMSDVHKTILRICPGEKPFPIFKKVDRTKNDENVTTEDALRDLFGTFNHNDEKSESVLDSFFGGGFFGNERGSIFDFGDPFRGLFGDRDRRESGQSENPRVPRIVVRRHQGHPSYGNRENSQFSEETEGHQSVMQPPHTLPKGKSPSINQGSGGLHGRAISPPENI